MEQIQLPPSNQLFIHGNWTTSLSTQHYQVYDPGTGHVLMSNVEANDDDIDSAVISSIQGQRGWQALSPAKRGQYLYDLAEKLKQQQEPFAIAETLDTGKPYSEALIDIKTCVDFLRYYAGLCDKLHGETIPVDEEQFSFTIQEPVGVTLHIIPWNFPLFTCIRGIAPALAAGCSVIIKPSEHAPISILMLAQMSRDLGFPAGVINVITGRGTQAGEGLCLHPGVNHITFTGSKLTGTRVLRAAAENMATCTMELGGKSPAIVFQDANLKQAAEDIISASFLNSGQVCSCASRIIIDKSIKDKFIDLLCSKLADISIGHGMSDHQFGAINNPIQMDKIEQAIQLAKQEGATILLGGKRYQNPTHTEGLYFLPTLLDNLPTDSVLLYQEVFGPIICLQSFEGVDQAISLANSTSFGLHAGIYTQDIALGLKLAKRIDAGQVNINQYYASEIYVPFGGNKHSGFGRECGKIAVQNYMKTKATTICLKT
ncbi:aldehyde dehydrogenase [Vibrio sagamiensis NBRC 104589]|uniref:Aldehyde dehydrogenase n=1 Tax=Vibrio sagamiensis NBRC 104589 TaxID=1219064 RepID=A0A511QEN6_9VIBR|nr:aldehyde dehydrogenase [Vibrio sagamiensis NBRC 104589]